MPGYKGHIAGGVTVYCIALYALVYVSQPTLLTAAEWFVFTIVGALFPDIDVKSKGQKLSYMIMLVVFVILLLRQQFEVVAVLGFLSLIPMIVRHRGLFHRLWFIILFAIAGLFTCSFAAALPCRLLLFDALFFVLGAFSHLVLDVGIKRTFRR